MSQANGNGNEAPKDLDAEQQLLGAMLLDGGLGFPETKHSRATPSIFPVVGERVREQDFFEFQHQVLFRCLTSLFADKKPVDITFAIDWLRSRNLLDAAGGPLFIALLEQRVVATTSAPDLAQMVADKAALRELQKEAREVVELSSGGAFSPVELTSRVLQRVTEIATTAGALGSLWPLGTFADCLVPQPPIQWAINGIFCANSINMVFGDPDNGKTLVIATACMYAAKGFLWLENHGTHDARPVLWINNDSPAPALRSREAAIAKGMGLDHPADLPGWHTLDHPDPAFDPLNERHISFLSGTIQRLGVKIVVIDALANLWGARDENSAEVLQIFQAFKRIVHKTGVCMILIHHANKDKGDPRGSSAIMGALDICVKIIKKSDNQFEIKPYKRRTHQVSNHNLSFNFGHKEDGATLDWLKFSRAEGEGTSSTGADLDDYLIFDFVKSHPRCTVREIESALNRDISPRAKLRAKREALVEKGHLMECAGNTTGKVFDVTPEGSMFFQNFNPKRAECAEACRHTGTLGDSKCAESDGTLGPTPVGGGPDGTLGTRSGPAPSEVDDVVSASASSTAESISNRGDDSEEWWER